jgi:hypothetical protein
MSDDVFAPDAHSRPRDRKIDEAKEVLLAQYFAEGTLEVYYGRQLEIWLEGLFFHWITKKGLNELAGEGRINFEERRSGSHVAHFYWPRGHRYPRRQMKQILSLIAKFSAPRFTEALGQHGELLSDAAFAYTGFRILQKNVREVEGVAWTETNHNLDRLIMRDGVRYGVEIKNQLAYIDQTEFEVKLAMCKHFGVRPLFIARMMPKNYISAAARAGGFSLVFGNQHYPLMARDLADEVRGRLKFPILCIRELPDTTMQRFVKWHEGHSGRGAAL